jgi:hypothetical protein
VWAGAFTDAVPVLIRALAPGHVAPSPATAWAGGVIAALLAIAPLLIDAARRRLTSGSFAGGTP